MREIEKITPEEENTYIRRLIPTLSRYPPGQWVRISDIARDLERFIHISQQLAKEGFFDDENGYCILEIKEDAFVRLDPQYLRARKPGFRIWK